MTSRYAHSRSAGGIKNASRAMRAGLRTTFRMVRAGATLAVGLLGAVPALCANSNNAAQLAEPKSSAPSQRPPAPPAWNPVDAFRQLLAMSPSERQKILGGKGEKQRQYLDARLREFDGMGQADRELRLRLLELQWYLLPLIKLPPNERAPQLDAVPEPWRALVKERLSDWDRLPPDQQQELLSNQSTLTRFPGAILTGPVQPAPGKTATSFSEQNNALESDLARWRMLPEEQRRRISANFDRLFSLSDRQRERGMRNLTESDKQKVQLLLTTFARLSSDQRARCLDAFNKFANMTPDERSRFLSNAARWKAMSPEEQRVWRILTGQLPPAPPGFPSLSPVPPIPPLPQDPAGRPATNRHAGL